MRSRLDWDEKEKAALYKKWQQRPEGMNLKDFASLQKSRHSMDSIRAMINVRRNTLIPVSRYAVRRTDLVIEGDVLILGDCHMPYHNATFINLCIQKAQDAGVDQLLLGGDACDMKAFSHWGDDFEAEDKMIMSSVLESRLLDFAGALTPAAREKLLDIVSNSERQEGNIGEEIRETRLVFQSLDKNFDAKFWMMGNHEKWVLRLLQKTMPAEELKNIFGVGGWSITSNYHAQIISGGVEWQVEHPVNSAKGTSKKLSVKFEKNIIMLHNHQLCIQADPSGRHLSVEPGMCCDETLMAYVEQRHNTADTHINGAVMIIGGKPVFINSLM